MRHTGVEGSLAVGQGMGAEAGALRAAAAVEEMGGSEACMGMEVATAVRRAVAARAAEAEAGSAMAAQREGLVAAAAAWGVLKQTSRSQPISAAALRARER